MLKNKKGTSLFHLKKSTIFADWFLHSRTTSEYIYNTKTLSICFTLDRKYYKTICSNDIDSAREFAVKSYLRYKYYKDINDIILSDIGNHY
jgi:hypothetical protein